MSEACCWPEQEAVEAWLEKYFLKVEHNAKHELKEAVTAYRLKIQKELEKLKKKQERLSERPQKKSDGLSKDKRAAYRHAKWLYFMRESSKRSLEGTKQRNKAVPEYASEEAKDFYEGQIKAYDGALNSLISELGLPPIEEILNERV